MPLECWRRGRLSFCVVRECEDAYHLVQCMVTPGGCCSTLLQHASIALALLGDLTTCEPQSHESKQPRWGEDKSGISADEKGQGFAVLW